MYYIFARFDVYPKTDKILSLLHIKYALLRIIQTKIQQEIRPAAFSEASLAPVRPNLICPSCSSGIRYLSTFSSTHSFISVCTRNIYTWYEV